MGPGAHDAARQLPEGVSPADLLDLVGVALASNLASHGVKLVGVDPVEGPIVRLPSVPRPMRLFDVVNGVIGGIVARRLVELENAAPRVTT